MYKSWLTYKQLLSESVYPDISLVEAVLMASVVFMMVLCTIDAYIGHDVGDAERLRLARLQGHQEMMALRSPEQ